MNKKKNEEEYFYLNDNDFDGDDSEFTSNSLELELRKKEEEEKLKLKKQKEKEKNQIQLVSYFEIINKQKKKDISKKINNYLPSQINFQTDEDYIEAINNLNNKLDNEKKNHELEIIKVNNEIKEKDNLIKSITNINLFMEKSLKKLNSKVEKLNNSENFFLTEKVEPIKIALEVKEKNIRNVQSLVNSISKENQTMKDILDNYNDYENKRILSDRLIYKEQQNNILKNQIKTLKIFNKDYDYWQKEKEDLNFAIQELENRLKYNKNENISEKKEVKLLYDKYYNFSDSDNSNSNNNSKKKDKTINQNEIKSNKENNNITKSFDCFNLKKLNKKKLVLTPTYNIINSKYNLLSKEEKEKIMKLYENDDDENKEKYKILIQKIEDLEKYRILKDKKELNKMKNENKEINEINNKINNLEEINENKLLNIRTLESQIIEYKNYKKSLQKKINYEIKILEGLKEKKKIKDKKNDLLMNKVNELQKIIKENYIQFNNDEELSNKKYYLKNENISKTPSNNYLKNKQILKEKLIGNKKK